MFASCAQFRQPYFLPSPRPARRFPSGSPRKLHRLACRFLLGAVVGFAFFERRGCSLFFSLFFFFLMGSPVVEQRGERAPRVSSRTEDGGRKI